MNKTMDGIIGKKAVPARMMFWYIINTIPGSLALFFFLYAYSVKEENKVMFGAYGMIISIIAVIPVLFISSYIVRYINKKIPIPQFRDRTDKYEKIYQKLIRKRNLDPQEQTPSHRQ